jgi:hypothetical protein
MKIPTARLRSCLRSVREVTNPTQKMRLAIFYVLHKECIICGVPQYLAPELIAWAMDAKGRPDHCIFENSRKLHLN